MTQRKQKKEKDVSLEDKFNIVMQILDNVNDDLNSLSATIEKQNIQIDKLNSRLGIQWVLIQIEPIDTN